MSIKSRYISLYMCGGILPVFGNITAWGERGGAEGWRVLLLSIVAAAVAGADSGEDSSVRYEKNRRKTARGRVGVKFLPRRRDRAHDNNNNNNLKNCFHTFEWHDWPVKLSPPETNPVPSSRFVRISFICTRVESIEIEYRPGGIQEILQLFHE